MLTGSFFCGQKCWYRAERRYETLFMVYTLVGLALETKDTDARGVSPRNNHFAAIASDQPSLEVSHVDIQRGRVLTEV